MHPAIGAQEPDAIDLAAMARLRDGTLASILAHCSEGDGRIGVSSAPQTHCPRDPRKRAHRPPGLTS
ncbi:hypothetical protein BCAR13_1060118 [Paraburkholderia caribensis]|nr:hypothetical protein BCAR13_1060118 [Paraburkholderia caribensis]